MASSKTVLGLEQIRRRKGISLQQIADSTKISNFFLSAIENEQFAKLPGGVFNRSYIRQYAAAIGIPENNLLDRYAAYEAEREAEENRTVATPPRRSYGLRWITSLIASVIAAVTSNS